MLLIPDNPTLLQFIPNTFGTQPGQPTLYDKIRPYLVTAEGWLIQNLIPEEMLVSLVDRAQSGDDPLYHLPRRLVALKAWIRAIPSVDIVVTANGVQVVETNTTKPAGKAKIDRLIDSLTDELDGVTAQLIERLHTIPGWIGTEQAEWFRGTLFQDLGILRTLGVFRDWWKSYVSLQPTLHDIEEAIARDYVSSPVMAQLRALSLTRKLGPVEKELVNKIRTAVRKTLLRQKGTAAEISGPYSFPAGDYPELEECVSLILSNECRFPGWSNSPQARFFRSKSFENKKSSTAYFM